MEAEVNSEMAYSVFGGSLISERYCKVTRAQP